jgi:hypothetical protein
MKAAPIIAALLFATWPAASSAADAEPPRTSMKETLRARMAEDAKKSPKAPAAKDSTPAKPAVPAPPAKEEEGAPEETTPKPDPAKTDPTLLPKVEVRKGKYSERDRQLALDLHKQDQDIARERKNLAVSETDLALNNSKLTKPLAIFGGDSAQFRQRVAAERVELMEAEKDIIEQIAIAQKPEEKKELQKQLDELRAMRRQLDKSLR